MKRFKEFAEVIDILVNKGYAIDFDQLARGKHGFYRPHSGNKPPEDFQVDEIFCCAEGLGDDEPIFVFAVSSRRHRFKGILINCFSEENTNFWMN